MSSSNDISNHANRVIFRSRHAVAAALMAVGLFAMAGLTPATADMGACNTAAPTSRTAHLFVSDVEQSARWYRDNAGLAEERRWVDPSFGGGPLVQLGRGHAGLTLVASPQQRGGFHDPQMVCLVLDGPPAPPVWSGPRHLVDPDGTAVELPPYLGNTP